MSALLSLIKAGKKPVVGMVQLAALPGSSRYTRGRIDDVLSAALNEADILASNGIDALIVQNLGDLPVTHRVSGSQIAWMTRITARSRRGANARSASISSRTTRRRCSQWPPRPAPISFASKFLSAR